MVALINLMYFRLLEHPISVLMCMCMNFMVQVGCIIVYRYQDNLVPLSTIPVRAPTHVKKGCWH